MILKQLKEKLNLKKENLIPLVFAITVTAIAVIDSKYFDYHLLGVMWIIIAILLSILVLIIMIIAGFTIMKSLFRISAGLSLIIFLAQSYCAGPVTSTGNIALMSLISIAFIYMLFDFFNTLYKAVTENFQKLKTQKGSFEKALFVLLFALFAYFFLWAIYEVISPIILNLCIYK